MVLNPSLYESLLRRYGEVRISNDGCVGYKTYTPMRDARNKLRYSVDVTGEEHYRVCCKYCRDTRFRLNFSYLWGTRDPRTQQQLLHLVCCFNEDCVNDIEVARQLYARIVAARGRGRDHRQSGGRAVFTSSPAPQFSGPISLPRTFVSLADVSPHHPARRYLASRDFNLSELVELWQVGYSDRDLHAKPALRQRIVVPIYGLPPFGTLDPAEEQFELVGWQARTIANAVPKYLTARGFSKSKHLYGLPHALDGSGPVAICEGVSDVWRLGGDAVATLGKSLSRTQLQLIVTLFAGRPLIVAYDRDADESNQQACRQLREARAKKGDSAPVAIISLPSGRQDVADCTRAEAWQCILVAANGRKTQPRRGTLTPYIE